MDKEKILKSISFALAISGIVLFIDILLTQFFSIGTEQKQFLLGYYCAMVFSNIVYPELKKRKGQIINIIDIHVDPPLKNHIIYSISKSGLLTLTKSLAKELAPYVRVNGISPGAILWPTFEKNLKRKKDIISKIPLKRTGKPEDIAKAVKFLIEDGQYITGQNINIDGGRKLNM